MTPTVLRCTLTLLSGARPLDARGRTAVPPTAAQRDLIRERTHAGLAAARTRGRHGGRPKTLLPAHDERIRQLHAQGKTITEIAAEMRVSRATIYRHLPQDP